MSKSTQVAAVRRISTWQDRLTRHVASERSVVGFCRDEGVSVASFYAWRHRLSARHGAPLATSLAGSSSQFIDLAPFSPAKPVRPVSPATAVMVTAGIELRIDLGHGIVITVVRH